LRPFQPIFVFRPNSIEVSPFEVVGWSLPGSSH
jgi:hypothetical protein